MQKESRPSAVRIEAQRFRGKYAHRGLYKNADGFPENSMKAFAAAVLENTGVELDVQLTKDGQVVVFHDDTLQRMCGREGAVCEYTYEELSAFPLLGTDQRIPLFSDVLRLLKKGTGMLLVELKNGKRNRELCEKTYALLRESGVTYCIESFQPFIVRWFLKNAPEVVRGLLATSREDYGPAAKGIVATVLTECRLAFLCRPDFIAYNKNAVLPEAVKKQFQKGVLHFAWTSMDADVDYKRYDAVIYECR